MATLTTFTAGTPILSADVNANFTAVNDQLEAITPTGVGEIAVGDGTATTRLAVGTSVLTFVHTGTLSAGQTSYLGFKEGASHALVAWAMPFACVIQRLHIRLETPPGIGQSLVFTVWEGAGSGSATALTCTLTGNNSFGSDLAHTETTALAELLSVKVVASAGAASTAYIRATIAVAPR